MAKFEIEVEREIIKGFTTETFLIEASSKEEALEIFNKIEEDESQDPYDYHTGTYYEVDSSEEIKRNVNSVEDAWT